MAKDQFCQNFMIVPFSRDKSHMGMIYANTRAVNEWVHAVTNMYYIML